MEFFEFRSSYEHMRRQGYIDKSMPPDDYYHQLTAGIRSSATLSTCRAEHNRLVAEWKWHEFGLPYYKVHPGVLAMLADVEIGIPIEYLTLPFDSFLVRLPKEQQVLLCEHGSPVQSFLVFSSDVLDAPGEKKFYLWLDLGEVDGQGYPVLSYIQMPCDPGQTIDEAFVALPREPNDLTEEQARQCLRLAVSVCFLATGADKLIAPDVLSKDFSKWLEAQKRGNEAAMRTIEERAIRKNKKGWNVGSGEQLIPARPRQGSADGEGTGRELTYRHQRRAHFHRLRNGEVKFMWQITVRPDLPSPPTTKAGFRVH